MYFSTQLGGDWAGDNSHDTGSLATRKKNRLVFSKPSTCGMKPWKIRFWRGKWKDGAGEDAQLSQMLVERCDSNQSVPNRRVGRES
jgi:hypothetical protein